MKNVKSAAWCEIWSAKNAGEVEKNRRCYRFVLDKPKSIHTPTYTVKFILYGNIQCLLYNNSFIGWILKIVQCSLEYESTCVMSYVSFCSNTRSIRDDLYWTSRKDILELIELFSINKVRLV